MNIKADSLSNEEIQFKIDKELRFRADLIDVINNYSKENGSNTPDFILADYLVGCLNNFNNIVKQREHWYGRENQFIGDTNIPPQSLP
jgi:hypothetical protein